MKRLTWHYQFFLLTVLALFSIHLNANTITPSLWQVKKNGVTSYLFGTVHLGDKEMVGLPNKVERALRNSKEVVVEVNLNQYSPMEIQQKSLKYMMFPAGKTLSSSLSSDSYNKLKKHLAEKGIDIALMEGIKPWGVMLNITLMEYQMAGFTEQGGIDKQVMQFATKHNIAISDLETLDQQLSMFNRFDKYNDELVLNGLKELADMDKYFARLITSWKQGNDQALENYYREAFTGNSYSKLSEQVLLVERNKNWVKQLKQPLTEKAHFIAVGALHLSSKTGLVSLLKQEGFSVTKL